jgi:hypothetical protein
MTRAEIDYQLLVIMTVVQSLAVALWVRATNRRNLARSARG